MPGRRCRTLPPRPLTRRGKKRALRSARRAARGGRGRRGRSPGRGRGRVAGRRGRHRGGGASGSGPGDPAPPPRAGRPACRPWRAPPAPPRPRGPAPGAVRVPPAGPPPDVRYIAVEGTGGPVIGAETQGRAGKGEDGKARTREVKLCCCFTQTSPGEDGRPVRDPQSSSYLATFAPAAKFGTLMAAEARRRGAAHVRQLVILGDGAHSIWNLASQHFPQATAIVDLYHAREHLHDLASLLEFMLADHKQHWPAARLGQLDDGHLPPICRAP